MSNYTTTANGWMIGAGYGPALSAATKARMTRRAKYLGLFLVSPFVGLAYLVTFPLVGLAMLAWMAGKAMMKSKAARPVALAIVAPFSRPGSRPPVLDTPTGFLVNVAPRFAHACALPTKGSLSAMDIRSLIRQIPDFPGPGQTYYDLTTLLADGPGFHAVIDRLAQRYAPLGIKKFACMEWRGFIIGAALAYRLDAGFVPIRKLGKLPGETIGRQHEFGHTSEPIEMSVNVISPGESVVLVDDMLATGAVSETAVMLIGELGGKVAECCFIHEAAALKGRERLEKRGLSVYTLWSD